MNPTQLQEAAQAIEDANRLVNGDRGSNTARIIVQYLRAGDLDSARGHYSLDGDKTTQYPTLEKVIYTHLGCRTHGTLNCTNRLCASIRESNEKVLRTKAFKVGQTVMFRPWLSPDRTYEGVVLSFWDGYGGEQIKATEVDLDRSWPIRGKYLRIKIATGLWAEGYYQALVVRNVPFGERDTDNIWVK